MAYTRVTADTPGLAAEVNNWSRGGDLFGSFVVGGLAANVENIPTATVVSFPWNRFRSGDPAYWSGTEIVIPADGVYEVRSRAVYTPMLASSGSCVVRHRTSGDGTLTNETPNPAAPIALTYWAGIMGAGAQSVAVSQAVSVDCLHLTDI